MYSVINRNIFGPGEVFGFFILAKFGIIFLRRHFRLKYILALQLFILLIRSSYL